jgi:hypothetical protein
MQTREDAWLFKKVNPKTERRVTDRDLSIERKGSKITTDS